MSVIGLIAAIMIMALPAVSIIALAFWARWLRRRAGVPRWAASVGYGFVVLGALPIVGAAAWSAWTMMGASGGVPTEKARRLAEAISATMYFGVLGLLGAIMGGLWIGFCTWRWNRAAAGG